ncbi:MAG: hypothetical protein GC202_02945 [Alphaproteobacteria bacterium]|nr:hypothetical protein [Alphaproteobacteria bacterium]
MEFIDAFDPDNAACERKFAFRSWTRIAASFEELGYRVHVTRRMADVRAFWERLPDAKRQVIRMPPVQDVAYHPNVLPEDFIAFQATRAGDNAPTAMVGARRVWVERSLKEEMEDLTFWYGDRAEEMRKQGRRCEVSAPSAREIDSEHIAWMGAGMNVSGDPLIYRAIVRASLFYVATHWRFKATVSIVERSTFRVHGFDWYGFRRNEMAVYRDDNEFLLATMPRRELLAEARHAAFADVGKPLLSRRHPAVVPVPAAEPVPVAG